MYDWLINTFNNREIATGIWLSIFAIFCILKLKTLGIMKNIVESFFGSGLFVLFGGLALWLSFWAFILNWIGWWTLGELKLTIFWFLFSGTVLLGRSIQNQDGPTFFRQVIRDQFKVIAALEFVVIFYSFSLLNEMLFVPFIAILSTVWAISETKSEYAPVKKFLNLVFSGIIIFLFYHFVTQTMSTKGEFWTAATVRKFSMPILLTIWALPYSYVLYCYCRWQEARIRINQKSYHCDSLKNYARRKFGWALFFRPVLLNRAVRQFNILPTKTRSDIHDIIQQVRRYEHDRSKPPSVPEELGWCPYAAEKFLSKDGLETEDFHNSGFDDEWCAASDTKYLDDARLFESLVYRAKGHEGFVNTLQLRGKFSIDPAPETGIGKMQVVATNLMRNAILMDYFPESLSDGFNAMGDVNEQLRMHKVYLKFTKFDDANILDVEFTVSTKD